jgi:hypothetical protein
MRAFRSDKELASYLRKLVEQRERQAPQEARPMMVPSPVAAADAGKSTTAGVASARARATQDEAAGDDESVTNVQHAGVDEGGIVKLHGNHLVVLRRGRLFTIAIGGGALKPISTLDAFGPDIDPDDAWYDEMLVSGNTVAVLGYSYERGGTEIGLFNINAAGQLRYRSTFHLRRPCRKSRRSLFSRTERSS